MINIMIMIILFAHKIFFECVLDNPKFNFEIRLKFNNEYNKKIIINLCENLRTFSK